MIERGNAAHRRLTLPTYIEGQVLLFRPPALMTPGFTPANVPGPTAVIGDRRSLATAAMALVALIAASGSFLLLAHRIERGAKPSAS